MATPASFPFSGASAVTGTINVATTATAFAPLVPKSMPARPVSLRLRFNCVGSVYSWGLFSCSLCLRLLLIGLGSKPG
jgi:hypothetical protein